jgi:hypothetical protein
MAMLARLRLADPNTFARLRASPERIDEQVPGATPADIALVAGDFEQAETLYLDELVSRGGQAKTWAGYGLALPAAQTGGPPASVSAAVLDQPELFSAVWRAITRSTGEPPPAADLAAWLAH